MLNKESNMSNIAWLVTGQTVTKSRFEEAVIANLPPAAMAEIWVGRTLNKQAVANINKAIEAGAPAPEEEGE